MNDVQRTKLVSITPPAAISTGATLTTTEIDTRGYDWLTVVVYLGATDTAYSALSITESDTTGSGHADITGLICGTSKNSAGSTSAVPSATDDNKFHVFDIDLRGRKRFIDVTATTGSVGSGASGAFTAIFGILSKAATGPSTAATRGATQLLQSPAFA